MADIRINSLPSTATSFNTDDYIAIDGASGGTRKMLAATLPLTDVTLGGSSGPSVKSSLSARAPRQGLVFDGTFNASISTAVPAFGTNDFSVAAIVNTDLSVNLAGIIGSNTTGGFGLFLYNSGVVNVQHIGVATIGSSTGAISANKSTLVVYTRSGTTGTFYINGVAAGTITDGSGGTPTNYSQTTNLLGQVGGLNIIKGTVAPLIYNRALSASEVVALYESGAPAGADYPAQVAGTALVTGDNSTFASNTGWWTLDNGATISGGALNTAGGSQGVYSGSAGQLLKKGSRYRLTVTLTAATGGAILQYYNGTAYQTFGSSAAGTYNVDFTATANYLLVIQQSGSGSLTIDTVTFTPLGLLLAPDAAQAGGGLVWYDTSGNAANISWTSGVSWNVPSSRVLGGNWSVSGTYNGTSGLLNIGTGVLDAELVNLAAATDGVGLSLLSTKTGGRRYFIVSSGGTSGYGQGKLVFGDETVGAYMALASTGNLLIGTTSDGGQKLQVSGTAAFSGAVTATGGVTTAALTAPVNTLAFNLNAGQSLTFSNTGPGSGGKVIANQDLAFGANTSGSLYLLAGNSTALTLDSSQNATFAGTSVTVDGASTGSTLTLKRASNANGAIISYKTTTTSKWYHGLRGLVDDNWYLQNDVAGNTALFFDASTSNATFAGTVTGTQFKSASGTTSAADGVATTVLSLSGKSGQMYLVHASLSGVNDAGNYAAFATVVMDGTSARIVSNNGTYMTLTLSGTNVQATQTSGVTQTIVYKYTSV